MGKGLIYFYNLQWIEKIKIIISVLIITISSILFFHSSSYFGGYDSYFFLLYANDLATSSSETSFARYLYFPGSYAFWSVIAKGTGYNFSSYQKVYACICLANAALTGLIIRRVGGGLLLAAGSFCCYLFFGQRIELESMTTECLTTLPTLFGILIWLINHQNGKINLGLAFFGASLGLCVFAKQQGAFAAVGAIGLAPYIWENSTSWRHCAGRIGILVSTMIIVFALAMKLDGGGIAAIKLGLSAALNYQAHGHFLSHIGNLAHKTPLLSGLLIASICFLPIAFINSQFRTTNHQRTLLHLWSLSVTIAIATLFQFTKRGYAHYGLMTLPFALISIAIAGLYLFEGLESFFAIPFESKNKQNVNFIVDFMFFIFIFAMLWTESRKPRLPFSTGMPLRHETYAHLRKDIWPRERLLLLPSRENALHWACQTNARETKWGYTFNHQENPSDYIKEIQNPKLFQVYIFKPSTSQGYEKEIFEMHDWSPFFVAMKQQGFRPIIDSNIGTLYQRLPPLNTQMKD